MAVSSIHNGWRYDSANSRLDFYYRGTRAGHINATGTSFTGTTTSAGALTVTAGGLTVTAGGLTVTAGGITVSSGDISLIDAEDLVLGTGSDALLRWSTGDADNHSLALGLGDSNQGLHITDKAAIATDWNIAATTHPNVYIHSNTTPATDYLRLGDHDGTTAYVDVVGGTTLAFEIGGTTEVDMTATVLNVLDGNILYVGVEATPGTTAGSNWIGIEDSGTDPAGTLTNSIAIYTPDAGDSLDFLHADGTTDSLGT